MARDLFLLGTAGLHFPGSLVTTGCHVIGSGQQHAMLTVFSPHLPLKPLTFLSLLSFPYQASGASRRL